MAQFKGKYCILSGVPLIEKTRRTTIPLLCSRPGSACDKRIRKKSSCVSSEDVNQGTGARKISRKGCLSSEDIQIQMRKLSRMTPERDWVMSASLHHLGKTEGLKRCFLFALSINTVVKVLTKDHYFYPQKMYCADFHNSWSSAQLLQTLQCWAL